MDNSELFKKLSELESKFDTLSKEKKTLVSSVIKRVKENAINSTDSKKTVKLVDDREANVTHKKKTRDVAVCYTIDTGLSVANQLVECFEKNGQQIDRIETNSTSDELDASVEKLITETSILIVVLSLNCLKNAQFVKSLTAARQSGTKALLVHDLMSCTFPDYSEQPAHLQSFFTEKAVTFIHDYAKEIGEDILERVNAKKAELASTAKNDLNKRIFLSQRRLTGQGIAGRLYEGLKNDYSVFLDTEAEFSLSDLDTIVSNCSIFILILTEGYINSEWCISELRSAVKYNKHIVIIRDSSFQVPEVNDIDLIDVQEILETRTMLTWMAEFNNHCISKLKENHLGACDTILQIRKLASNRDRHMNLILDNDTGTLTEYLLWANVNSGENLGFLYFSSIEMRIAINEWSKIRNLVSLQVGAHSDFTSIAMESIMNNCKYLEVLEISAAPNFDDQALDHIQSPQKNLRLILEDLTTITEEGMIRLINRCTLKYLVISRIPVSDKFFNEMSKIRMNLNYMRIANISLFNDKCSDYLSDCYIDEIEIFRLYCLSYNGINKLVSSKYINHISVIGHGWMDSDKLDKMLSSKNKKQRRNEFKDHLDNLKLNESSIMIDKYEKKIENIEREINSLKIRLPDQILSHPVDNDSISTKTATSDWKPSGNKPSDTKVLDALIIFYKDTGISASRYLKQSIHKKHPSIRVDSIGFSLTDDIDLDELEKRVSQSYSIVIILSKDSLNSNGLIRSMECADPYSSSVRVILVHDADTCFFPASQPASVKHFFSEKAVTLLGDYSDAVCEQVVQRIHEKKEEIELQKTFIDESESVSHLNENVKTDLFLSHRRLTAQMIAGRLYESLFKDYSVFLDSEAQFKIHDLGYIVEHTKYFVMILSAGYFESWWCMRELESAIKNKCKTIIIQDYRYRLPIEMPHCFGFIDPIELKNLIESSPKFIWMGEYHNECVSKVKSIILGPSLKIMDQINEYINWCSSSSNSTSDINLSRCFNNQSPLIIGNYPISVNDLLFGVREGLKYKVEAIDIRRNLTDQEMRSLAKTAKTVILSDGCHSSLDIILKHLVRSNQVEDLTIIGGDLSPSEASQISSLKLIKKLSLIYCTGIIPQLSSLNLTTLNLSGSSVSDSIINTLVKSEKSKDLEEIKLSDCEGCTENVLKMLSSFPNLKKVDITFNSWGKTDFLSKKGINVVA